MQERQRNIGLTIPHDSRAFPASRRNSCAECAGSAEQSTKPGNQTLLDPRHFRRGERTQFCQFFAGETIRRTTLSFCWPPAANKPMRRTLPCCSAGNFEARIEINISLSTPSTISRARSVASADHASGSDNQVMPKDCFSGISAAC